MKTIAALVLGLLLLLPLTAGAQVSVLQKDGSPFTGPTPPPPYAKLLADSGFALGFPPQAMRAPGKLSAELLAKFNVVVVPSLGGWVTDQKPEDVGKVLDAYLKSGGGVLLFQDTYLEGIPMQESTNAWLKQYGVQYRWGELDDPAHTYANPPAVPWQTPKFLWTDYVAKSPLTSDVNNLFYLPLSFRGPHMSPLTVDKSWQVLLSTPASAQLYPLTADKADVMVQRVKEAAPTAGPFPLLAVRQVGKGRLAVFAGSPATFWFDLGKPVYAQVPQARGDGQRKSDWQPLLFNVLRWLAEPGAKAGKPGGYTGQPQFQPQPDWGNHTPINWEAEDPTHVSPALVQQTVAWHGSLTPELWRDWELGKYRPYKLLVGAKSVLSGGKGTVADWKAAAQAAGYSAVVFREDILNLTKEQWDKFLADCKAATDANFVAIPGQEFEDWIGNRFLRFTGDLAYPPHPERLTNNKMRDQLSWFCDVGWPVNLPTSVKQNPTEFWNYRLTYGWPLYVYSGGKLQEDNRRTWEELVDSYEYPTPLALHMIDDPAQIAGLAADAQTYVLGNGLPNFDGNSAGGLAGCSNNPRIFTSTGPMIDRFQAVNMFRTTLGQRGLPGTYRYEVFLKAHSDKPIARVELWGGDEPIRVYRPLTKEFSVVVDELHDRQRGLWLKVVDVDGGEARATGIMVHDKMLEFVWCGDLENALPYGLGTDSEGNVGVLGIGTRVKSSFQGIDGPATGGYDMWRYVPWGTDTSAPAVGLLGDPRLVGADGKHVPPDTEWYTSRVTMPYGNRDVMFERLTAERSVTWQDYVPKYQPTVNGWYPYTADHDLPVFTLVHDDVEFHRSLQEPAIQWNRGVMTFKQATTLSATEPINVRLAYFNNNLPLPEVYTRAGVVSLGASVVKPGRGGYVSWPAPMGNITVFALDDDLGFSLNNDGKRVTLQMGYSLPGKQFAAGDTLTYQSVVMRWPSGRPISDRLDVRVADALDLAGRGPAYTVTPRQGKVVGTSLFLDLEAQDGIFAGTFSRAYLGMRTPTRVFGLNPRWTAGLWRAGVAGQVLEPLQPNPQDGAAYLQLDLEKESGDLFLGCLATCDQPTVWLRAIQRFDGGFDLVVHNPGEAALTANVKGSTGGPLAGWTQTLPLAPGEEKRVKVN
ncbi:MAG TPA: hypothetical protein VGM19_14885 [Armatimonadota bacterium]|jgi:hypothetical protein